MKTKIKDSELFGKIRGFLISYLPVVKKKSVNTVNAYRDALNLYLKYICESGKKELKDIVLADFSQKNIVLFLDWLKTVRGNEATTINQRLSHIKGFCKYLMKKDVLSFIACEEICDISEYKDNRVADFVWLSIEDVKLVLELPNLKKNTGIRDRFFIALMYESGCRDDEILHLKLKDFVINKNGEPDVHIFGKGNKHRNTPLSADIVPYFEEYCNIYHPDIEKSYDKLMFYTVRNGITAQMSADNTQRFMNEYEKKAKNIKADIPHLHPHLWRRTRAMHLYMAGVALPIVSEWLGHSSEETTQIYYAKATDEMKRQAQRKLNENTDSVFKENIAFKYAADEEMIRRLCGLK